MDTACRMDIDTLLSTVASRPRKRGYGIGTKAAYWSDLEHCYKGGYCPSKLFANAPAAEEYRQLVKQAERELVWSDPGQTIEKFGSASTTQTPGALADFDCVISSYRKDRDGDRLNPKGADLDPKAPLLWQHIPFEPVGKLCSGGLSGKIITGHCCIANTELGRDAATLVELGALRISHGFQPDEWEPLDDDQGKGFLISKYEIMEVSLVSIPSNTDAVITAFSRNKLHHPAVKQWAGSKHARRTKKFQVAIDLSLLANGQPIASLATDASTKSCTCTADGAGCRTGHAHSQGAAMELETKGVQPKRDIAKAPREHEWDAGEARKRLEAWAGGPEKDKIDWKKYAKAFIFVEGKGDEYGDFKLPFCDVLGGELKMVYKALVACKSVLDGGRGGVDISDKAGALARVEAYLKEFGDKPDDKDDEGKTVTDMQTKGSYCTSAHMDRMKAAHHLVKAAHKHGDVGDEPRSLLNSARGHLDTAIRGIESGEKSATLGEKGHHVPSIYLDIIKSAHHLIKSAGRHKATGDEPRRLLNDAHNHLDTVIKAINAVDEVGRDSDYDEDEDPPGTGEGKRAPDDVDSALDMAMNRGFDGKFTDLQKCQHLYKALGDMIRRRKEAETQARLNKLLGLS